MQFSVIPKKKRKLKMISRLKNFNENSDLYYNVLQKGNVLQCITKRKCITMYYKKKNVLQCITRLFRRDFLIILYINSVLQCNTDRKKNLLLTYLLFVIHYITLQNMNKHFSQFKINLYYNVIQKNPSFLWD